MSTEQASYRLLLHGIDTVQCGYYLTPPRAKYLDFARLASIKEQLRMDKSREPRAVKLGATEFFLQPYGSSSGYPFVLTNADFKIELGEFNSPSFFVTYRSQALWAQSASALHTKFLDWALRLGCEVQKPETLSRVDFCFDYSLVERDFDEDSFVSISSKDSQHREHGAVWRIEWQVRKAILRVFSIRTFADLQEHQGTLLSSLATHHDTLRSRTEDSNRSRWPLHPLWIDLQRCIGELHTLGTKQVEGKELALEERLVRLTISMYGYLKWMAAVSCVKHEQPMMTEEEAYRLLGERLRHLFDPLSWKPDVQKRIKAIELGEW